MSNIFANEEVEKGNCRQIVSRLAAEQLFKTNSSLSAIDGNDVERAITDYVKLPVFIKEEYVKSIGQTVRVTKQFCDVYDPLSQTMFNLVNNKLTKLYENRAHTVANFKTDNKSIKNTMKWVADNFKAISKNDIKSLTQYILKNIAEQQFIALYDTHSSSYEEDLKKYFNCHTTINDAANLIIYSATKGAGKSTSIDNYIKQYKKAGFNTPNYVVNAPTGGFNVPSEFSEYSLLQLNELHKDTVYDKTTLMNIGRREYYQYEKKFHTPVQLKAIARWLSSTNDTLPSVFNDRTILTVNTISAAYNIIKESFGELEVDPNTNIFKTDVKKLQRLYDLLETFDVDNCELETNNKEINSLLPTLKKLFNDEYLYLLARVTTALTVNVHTGKDDTFSVASIIRTLNNHDATILDSYYKERTLLEIFQKLYSKGIITRANNNSGKYCKYHLGCLLNLTEDLIDGKTEDTSIVDEIKQARQVWDKLIALAEKIDNEFPDTTDPTPTDDNDPFDKDYSDEEFTKEDVKATHMFGNDVVNSLPTVDIKEDTQFIVSAEPKKEYIKEIQETGETLSRCKNDYYPTCFVYEMDETPLEEQEELMKNVVRRIPNNIYSLTYSGSKSFHCLVWIKPEDRVHMNSDNFKWYWTEVAKQLFGTRWEELDEADATICRLTRRPGAIRDNGKKQTCLYMNRNVVGLDLTTLIRQRKELDKREAEIKIREEALRKYKQQSFQFEEQDLMTQLQNIANKTNSDSGKLAYEILSSGTAESGSNMIGAIGYMKKLKDSDNKWEILLHELYNICHTQHPSNITKSYEQYTK